MWVVTSLCATLSDYTTMVEFMRQEFVTEAFVVYDHRRSHLQLCCLIDEDQEVLTLMEGQVTTYGEGYLSHDLKTAINEIKEYFAQG